MVPIHRDGGRERVQQGTLERLAVGRRLGKGVCRIIYWNHLLGYIVPRTTYPKDGHYTMAIRINFPPPPPPPPPPPLFKLYDYCTIYGCHLKLNLDALKYTMFNVKTYFIIMSLYLSYKSYANSRCLHIGVVRAEDRLGGGEKGIVERRLNVTSVDERLAGKTGHFLPVREKEKAWIRYKTIGI